MGAFVSALTGAVAPVLDAVKGIVEEFHLSPEAKARIDAQLADANEKARQAAQNYDVQLNTIAGENIRAETQSQDRYTGRARPTVIYVGCLFIFWNWGLLPLIGLRWGMQPSNVPEAFWWAWTTIVTGYVFSRGVENVSAMPGHSQISLPFNFGVTQTSLPQK